MKKLFLLLLLSIAVNICIGQIVADTIIKTEILECHFSYKYHNPIMVKYKLYKGGGDCDRSKFHFKTGDVKNSATSNDYKKSGFDKGHLVSAEDFAYDCKKDSMTFFYYNAIPQTPNLNRGTWKVYETKIREISQEDSLLIMCGGIYEEIKTDSSLVDSVVVFGLNKILNTEVCIPKYCWKIVKSLSTNEILYSLLFSNEIDNNYVKIISIEDLEEKVGYKILIHGN